MAIEVDKDRAVIVAASPESGELIIGDTAAMGEQGSAGKTDALVPVSPIIIRPEREKNTELVGFFAIGVVINLIMVTAFFIWAFKQWKQN